MKILELRLRGYREWTESLGSDREWKIQSVQHDLASRLAKVAGEVGSFSIPYRFDSYILLADGVSSEGLERVIDSFSKVAPVRVEACWGFGEDYLEALKSCGSRREYPDTEVLVAHFDLDGFTALSDRTDAFLKVREFAREVEEFFLERGGLTHYLGGDNVVVFLPPSRKDSVVEFLKGKTGVKVGVGVGKTPREALSVAAEQLDSIRRARVWAKRGCT
ncbi:MAG: GTP cyclohydrolase IIa [Thermoprotei archaeon]